jgi:septal ring factor EnvC (AmiA/AmiB activator)
LAAAAETHVEWAFSCRIENDQGLKFAVKKPAPKRASGELLFATRSTFHCTLGKLDPNPPTRGAAATATSAALPIDKAAALRLLRPTLAELPVLEQRATTDSQRALLKALCSPDPLQLIAEMAKPEADKTGRELAELIANTRTELLAKAHADVVAWTDETEGRLAKLEQAAAEAQQRAAAEAAKALRERLQAAEGKSQEPATEGEVPAPASVMVPPMAAVRPRTAVAALPESFGARLARLHR